MRILNVAIMKEPINWVKIPLMALFGMIALYLIVQFVTPATPKNEDQ